MGRMNNPCRYCTPPKRNEWCHGMCKEYADYRADIDARAYRKYQEEAANVVLAEGAIERKIRYRRKGGKR